MEKILISESNRIKEIMGISTTNNVLSEQWASEIEDLITSLRNGGKITQEIDTLLKDFAEDLVKNSQSKKKLGDFLKSSEGQRTIREIESEISQLPDGIRKSMAKRNLGKLKSAEKNWGSRVSGGGNRGGNTGGNTGGSSVKILSDEAEALFGRVGRNLTSQERDFIESVSEKIYKNSKTLTDAEILKLENLGLDVKRAIDKLKNAKDSRLRMRGNTLDNFIKNLKLGAETGSKIPVYKIGKTVVNLIGVMIILKMYNKISTITIAGEHLPQLPSPIGPGESIFADGSSTPTQTPNQTPETTPDNNLPLETW